VGIVAQHTAVVMVCRHVRWQGEFEQFSIEYYDCLRLLRYVLICTAVKKVVGHTA
jgi:hypothetical protein